MTGCVYLIGAGCGTMDLMTLRGLERLKHCDAVVYDDLIDQALLQIPPDRAERISMGKRSGRHSAPQGEISQTLIELARNGKRVARLKGGDPFVFGRGGEEILALQAAGIPFEEVPGISSSIAIPAAAGIPVTHRGISRSFQVITAHTAVRDGLPRDLPQLAALHGTLVFLMGLSRLEALAEGLRLHGMAPETPAAVISGGNAPHPATVRGTLADIAGKTRTAGVLPPAVIVVGETAALDLNRGAIRRPLEGARVGLTGTDSLTEKLGRALDREGARSVPAERSLVEPIPLSVPLERLCDGRPHWLVLTSANGVRLFFQRLREARLDLRRLHACQFAVIGAPTGAVLEEYGIRADLCPAVYTSAALAELLCQQAAPGEDFYLLRAENGAEILPRRLREQGFSVEEVPLYRLRADHRVSLQAQGSLEQLDYLTFSSAGGVRLFLEEHGTLPRHPTCVCIGTVTAKALRDHSSAPILVAEEATVDSLVKTIRDHWSTKTDL